MKNFIKPGLCVLVLFIVNACATYKVQYLNPDFSTSVPDKKIIHTFYLIGDAGNSPVEGSTTALQAFKQELGSGTTWF